MDGVPTQLVLYVATVLGAVCLFCLMPLRAADAPFRLRHLKAAGALLAAATLGAAWIVLCPLLRGEGIDETGIGASGLIFYYVFSLLGIVSAVRVITHERPVYSALWFVMTVIASSGLFLVLAAEFMAFAMLIIYGGAILVTYMFVIMLATEPRSEEGPEGLPAYERYATEPLGAVVTAFVLLAVLLSFMFQPMEANPAAAAASDAEVAVLLDRQASVAFGQETSPAVEAAVGTTAADVATTGDRAGLRVVEAPAPVTNLQRVGLDLFQANPLAVELAGVILLLSLIGAVVIANTQVPREDGGGADPTSGRDPEHPIETGGEKPGIGGADVVQVA